MARRKKHSRKRKHSRRRMGAVGKANIGTALGIIAGAVIGKKVAGMIPVADDRIKHAAVTAVGIFLPTLWKGDMGKALGNGMIAVGGASLIADFVPALGAVDTMEFPVAVGAADHNISVIAGDDSVMAGDNLSVIAGYEEDENY